MNIQAKIVEAIASVYKENPKIQWTQIDEMVNVRPDKATQVLGFGKMYSPQLQTDVVVYALVLMPTGIGLFKVSTFVEVCLNHLHDKYLTLSFSEVEADFMKSVDDDAIDEDDATSFWYI